MNRIVPPFGSGPVANIQAKKISPGGGPGVVQRVVASDQGQRVGVVDVRSAGADAMEFFNLSVDPVHRKQGWGKHLIGKALQVGTIQGKSIVQLESEDNGSGRLTRWYAEMGFARVGTSGRGLPVMRAPISRIRAAISPVSAPGVGHGSVQPMMAGRATGPAVPAPCGGRVGTVQPMMARATATPAAPLPHGARAGAVQPMMARAPAMPAVLAPQGARAAPVQPMMARMPAPRPMAMAYRPPASVQPKMMTPPRLGPGSEIVQRARATRASTLNDMQVSGDLDERLIVDGARARRGVDRYGAGDGTAYGVGGYAAYMGIATRNINRRFSADETQGVNRLGDTYGCHTCGSKDSLWDDGHWTPDHQPPLSLANRADYQGHLYPHCRRCSSHQGGILAAMG